MLLQVKERLAQTPVDCDGQLIATYLDGAAFASFASFVRGLIFLSGISEKVCLQKVDCYLERIRYKT